MLLMLDKELKSGVQADGVFFYIKSIFEFRRSLCSGRLFFFQKKEKRIRKSACYYFAFRLY